MSLLPGRDRTGRAQTPCVPSPSQKPQDPIPHPGNSSCCPIAPCSSVKPPRPGEVLAQGWGSPTAPRRTLAFSGHVISRVEVARNNLMLVPVLYPSPPLRSVVAFPGRTGDGQRQGSHGPILHGSAPGLLSVPGAASPARLAPCRDGTAAARGRSPPYGAPGRLPTLGQVLSSGLHKTLLSAPAGFPSPGRDPRQPLPLSSPQHCQGNGLARPHTAASPPGLPADDALHAAGVPL